MYGTDTFITGIEIWLLKDFYCRLPSTSELCRVVVYQVKYIVDCIILYSLLEYSLFLT